MSAATPATPRRLPANMSFAGVPDRRSHYQAVARSLPLVPSIVAALVAGIVTAVLSWWWLGLLVAVAAGAAVFTLRPRHAMDRVLDRYQLTEMDAARHPRLDNLVESLCYAAGVDEPDVYLLASPTMNLAAVADVHRSALIVTEGMADSCTRIELEAVLAAGLARVRGGDAYLGTVSSVLVGGPLLHNGPGVSGRWSSFANWFVGARASKLRSLFPEHRPFETDLSAASITRYPPALRSALEKMRTLGTSVPGATWGTAHLFLADPLPAPNDERERRMAALFDLHGDLTQRVDLIAEL